MFLGSFPFIYLLGLHAEMWLTILKLYYNTLLKFVYLFYAVWANVVISGNHKLAKVGKDLQKLSAADSALAPVSTTAGCIGLCPAGFWPSPLVP